MQTEDPEFHPVSTDRLISIHDKCVTVLGDHVKKVAVRGCPNTRRRHVPCEKRPVLENTL